MNKKIISRLFLSHCFLVSYTYFEANAFPTRPKRKRNNEAQKTEDVTDDITKEVIVNQNTEDLEGSTETVTNLPNKRFLRD